MASEQSKFEALTSEEQPQSGDYRPIIIDGCNIGHSYGKVVFVKVC